MLLGNFLRGSSNLENISKQWTPTWIVSSQIQNLCNSLLKLRLLLLRDVGMPSNKTSIEPQKKQKRIRGCFGLKFMLCFCLCLSSFDFRISSLKRVQTWKSQVWHCKDPRSKIQGYPFFFLGSRAEILDPNISRSKIKDPRFSRNFSWIQGRNLGSWTWVQNQRFWTLMGRPKPKPRPKKSKTKKTQDLGPHRGVPNQNPQI